MTPPEYKVLCVNKCFVFSQKLIGLVANINSWGNIFDDWNESNYEHTKLKKDSIHEIPLFVYFVS